MFNLGRLLTCPLILLFMGWFSNLLGDIPIIGDAVNWLGGHYENNRNQHFQSDESAANRYWQTEESQKARDWQTRENQIARDWQANQWQTQFFAQNKEYDRRLQQERDYNDPSAQARRLASAGINPASMSGDQSGGTSFAAPDSPSLSTPSVQSSPVASPVGYPSTSIPQQPNLAQSIAALSNARFNDAQADRVYGLLEGEIYMQGIEKGLKDLEYDIQSHTKNYKIINAFADYQEKISRILLNGELTTSEKKKQALYVSEEFANYARGGLDHSTMSLVELKLKRFNEIVDADLRLKEAQTREARAASGMMSAQERHYAALAREVDWFNDVRGDSSDDNQVFKSAKNRIIAEANKLIREGNLTNEQIKEVQQKVKRLEKENNIFYAKQISNEIKDYLDIGADIYRTSTFQNFFNSESSRKNRRDEFEREHYNDVEEYYERETPTYSGKEKHSVRRKRK